MHWYRVLIIWSDGTVEDTGQNMTGDDLPVFDGVMHILYGELYSGCVGVIS